MRHNKAGGFTLIELLIVIAIIGILAAVLIPNLMRSRQVAIDRSAEAYARNVYTAAMAFLAEDAGNTLAAGDCTNGVAAGGAFGAYSVGDPGDFVTDCDYTADGALVTVTFDRGTAGAGATVTAP